MLVETGGTIMTLLKSMFSTIERATGCVVAGASAFFAPIYLVLVIAAGFIICDAVQGYKVGRRYGYTKIESKKLWKTLNKLTEAIILITGAYTIDAHVVTSVNLYAVEFIAGAICFTEFVSLLESYVELNDSKTVAKLLKKIIKAKGLKYLDILIEDSDLDNRGDTKKKRKYGTNKNNRKQN